MKKFVYVLIILLLLMFQTNANNYIFADEMLEIPQITGEYTYNGKEQTANIEYDATKIKVSGNKATNAGVYTVTFTLISDRDYWPDGSKSNKTAVWEIQKATFDFTDYYISMVRDDDDNITLDFSKISPNITAVYSLEENGKYTDKLNLKDGTYTIYYKISDPNYYDYSGKVTVNVNNTNHFLILLYMLLITGAIIFIFIVFVGIYYNKTGTIPFKKFIQNLENKEK